MFSWLRRYYNRNKIIAKNFERVVARRNKTSNNIYFISTFLADMHRDTSHDVPETKNIEVYFKESFDHLVMAILYDRTQYGHPYSCFVHGGTYKLLDAYGRIHTIEIDGKYRIMFDNLLYDLVIAGDTSIDKFLGSKIWLL